MKWISTFRNLGSIRKKIQAGEDVSSLLGNDTVTATTEVAAEIATEGATEGSLEIVEEKEENAVQSRARTDSQLTMDEMEQLAEEKEEKEEAQALQETAVDHVKTSRSEGWLYKLGESKMGFLGAYRKRWFSLHKNDLPYYKHVPTMGAFEIAAGKINFKNVMEVRQSSASGCPEHTIEIVTPGRVYTVVPEDHSNDDVLFERWMNELRNAADIYGKLSFQIECANNYAW